MASETKNISVPEVVKFLNRGGWVISKVALPGQQSTIQGNEVSVVEDIQVEHAPRTLLIETVGGRVAFIPIEPDSGLTVREHEGAPLWIKCKGTCLYVDHRFNAEFAARKANGPQMQRAIPLLPRPAIPVAAKPAARFYYAKTGNVITFFHRANVDAANAARRVKRDPA